MRSKDDPELLHNFTNSWLAEPWEDTKLKTNAELVMERQTETPEWTLPPWTKLITGGIDVQENCLYWTIRAWGDYKMCIRDRIICAEMTLLVVCWGLAEFALAVLRIEIGLTNWAMGGFILAAALIGAAFRTCLLYTSRKGGTHGLRS